MPVWIRVIIGIAASIFTVIGLGGIRQDLEGWERVLSQDFAKWIFLPAAAICWILFGLPFLIPKGYFRNRWRRARYSRELVNIEFPDSPSEPFWKVDAKPGVGGLGWGARNVPQAVARCGKALKVEMDLRQEGYCIDHHFVSAIPSAQYLDIVLNTSDKATALDDKVYVHICIATPSGEQKKVWICYRRDMANNPQVSHHEWHLLLGEPTERFDDGWGRYRRDLVADVRDTFGRQGCNYKGATGFRLRGPLFIATLRLIGPASVLDTATNFFRHLREE